MLVVGGGASGCLLLPLEEKIRREVDWMDLRVGPDMQEVVSLNMVIDGWEARI